LLNVNEILGLRLVSIHNSHFFLKVMADVRMHLRSGTFGEFRRQFIANYVPTEKVRADRMAHQAKKAKLTSPLPTPETAQE
jgi:queuine tRNA-ribosyltransferase